MLFATKTWTKETIRNEAEKIIRSIMKSYEKEEIGDDTEAFFEQLDSLRIIELVVLTEKKFRIQFSQEQLESLSGQNMEAFISAIESSML